MKTLIAIAAAALLLPGAALAQTSGQQPNQGYSQPGSQQNQNTSQNQNNQNRQNNQSNPNSTYNQSQSNSGEEQTIEGCVTRQETDYYITPINGNRVRLHSYEDMSGAANHMARVHGHYGTGGATTSRNPAYNGNSSSNSSNPNGQSQYGQQSSNAGTGMTGQTGQSGNGQSSSANGQNGNSANGGDFLVTRVETISSSCPANGPGAGNQPRQ